MLLKEKFISWVWYKLVIRQLSNNFFLLVHCIAHRWFPKNYSAIVFVAAVSQQSKWLNVCASEDLPTAYQSKYKYNNLVDYDWIFYCRIFDAYWSFIHSFIRSALLCISSHHHNTMNSYFSMLMTFLWMIDKAAVYWISFAFTHILHLSYYLWLYRYYCSDSDNFVSFNALMRTVS